MESKKIRGGVCRPFLLFIHIKLTLEIEAHKQGRSLNNLLTQIVKEYLKAKK